MGYSTDFYGKFTLNKPLTIKQYNYLKKFSETRRMKRNAEVAETLTDPIRKAAHLPIGKEGAYYVGSTEDFGQERDASVKDYNDPPEGQPGLWCQWVPTEDGEGIEWDGGEKFYDYVKWLEYIIENFLKPWGYILEGEVKWQGEDPTDTGKIIVKNNKVSTKKGRVVYR